MASDKVETLKHIANRLRVYSIEATSAANSGHPTSCMSAAEVIAVLFHSEMRYSVESPRDPSSDRFILSKGHAAPVLYAAWHVAGHKNVTHKDLLDLRKFGAPLEGHPTPKLDFVDVATGSLGQGLSVACGMAYTGKHWDKSNYRTYCMMGDGESAEGSVWEAFAFAGYYKLDNLVAIFDVNRLGQSEPTSLQHSTDVYKKRAEAFGWNAIVVDGHDIKAILAAFEAARNHKGQPTCLVCKTYKGYAWDDAAKGISDELNWHGKPLGARAEDVLAKIKAGTDMSAFIKPQAPTDTAPVVKPGFIALSSPPDYKPDDKIATRFAYGTALVKLGQSCDRIVAMDGDTKNSTFALTYKKAFEERFVECFIAEQNLVGVGIGCGCRGRTIPFISTFAAFFTRAFDQIRMGAISQANIKCVGSHAGISIGEDGPSQMALEDLAMFRTIHNATVFYPSDPVSMERAMELTANTQGIVFIRTSRPPSLCVYPNDEVFEVGKSKVLRQSSADKVTVVGAGVTLHEALKAHDELKAAGINVRVVDIFCLKPIDSDLLKASVAATGGKLVTVEDHYPEGGIGGACAEALSEVAGVVHRRLAVQGMPTSGPCAKLLEVHGISASHIVAACKDLA